MSNKLVITVPDDKDPSDFEIIPKRTLDFLIKSQQWRYALEAAGVDQWEGYERAREIMEEWGDDE